MEEWTSTKDVHIIKGLVSGKKYILHEDLAPSSSFSLVASTFEISVAVFLLRTSSSFE